MNVSKQSSFICDDSQLVKITQMGNITQLLMLEHKNSECAIRKISNEEYYLIATGEVKKCNHIDDRSQNMNTIRYSIAKLRNLICNNFFGGNNELWITLTFGKEKVYDPKKLCPIFDKFIKRLRYYFKEHKIDYIYVPEPHEKGDWHIHLLLKSDKSLYIENSLLNQLWGNGFVKVNRLTDIDNIGAYVSSYLINIKDGESTKKGARLSLYPPNHQLYRCSKGILQPISRYVSYRALKNEIKEKKLVLGKLTYDNTLRVESDEFNNVIHYEYYNTKR